MEFKVQTKSERWIEEGEKKGNGVNVRELTGRSVNRALVFPASERR